VKKVELIEIEKEKQCCLEGSVSKFIPQCNKLIKQVIAQIINVFHKELVTLFCLVFSDLVAKCQLCMELHILATYLWVETEWMK